MSWTHLSDSTPVARKPHRCYLCEGEIPKGEKHLCRTGIDGEAGRPVTFRMHLGCHELTKGWDEDDWGCFDPSDFRYGLAEAEKAKAAKAAKEGAES